MDEMVHQFSNWPEVIKPFFDPKQSAGHSTDKLNKNIIPILTEARHFIFSNQFMETYKLKKIIFDSSKDILSLPFSRVAFELFSEQISLEFPIKMGINFFCISEVGPLDFEFVVHAVTNGVPNLFWVDRKIKDRDIGPLYDALLAVSFNLCNYLRDPQNHIGSCKPRTGTQKIKINKESHFVRPRPIVICTPKKEKTVERGDLTAIDWSHRWEVRGHWRAVPGKIGKNREGKFCIRDFTWVIPHVKGPEEKELIIKTRVKLQEMKYAS